MTARSVVSAFLVWFACVTPAAFAAAMENDTDRIGSDFNDFDLPTANPVLCQEACAGDPKCQAWTYVRPNTIQGPRPRCWLKYAVPNPRPSTCCVSGVKSESATPPVTTVPQALNLTGRWSANDGGTYYLRQIGNELWWYGRSGDSGATWSNVFHATIQGNRLVGRWADVPQGQVMSGGEMELTITSADRLTAARRTGGFGGSEWTRQGSSATTTPTAGGSVTTALETLTIPNDKPVKIQSNTVLENGRWYILEASGVVSDWDPTGKDGGGVDPVWCYAEWRCGKGEAWNQLRIDEKGLTDIGGGNIPYNPQHVYRVRIQGQGRPLVAYASDAQGSSQDNWGAFTLRIHADAPGAPTVAAAGVFLGCYRDQGDPAGTGGRDLNGAVLNAGNTTTESCVALCAEKGFAFAGTQYTSWCFCGNSYGRSGTADNCNMPCAGNSRQTCGGAWANTVYSVGPGVAAAGGAGTAARRADQPSPQSQPGDPVKELLRDALEGLFSR